MNTQADTLDITFDMLVDVNPGDVPAGGELVLRCAARTTPERDLRGKAVRIFDASGEKVGTLTFTMLDGATNTTEPVSVTAPTALGPQCWHAEIAGASEDLLSSGGASTDFYFTVVPHKTGLLVWGAPSAIACGSEFAVTIGLKCTGSCSMADHEIHIHDSNGNKVATARMDDTILSGTSGLHQTTVTLQAPATVSREVWEARFEGDDRKLPHAPGAMSFGLNFVEPAEHTITMSVMDAETKAPISGANVVAHPFRARTDADGIARLMVSKGSYTVWISAPGHDPVCQFLDIATDHNSVAELSPEIEEDPDAAYV